MNENWKFSDIPYHRPDVEALQARYDALTRRAREARSPEELVEIVRQRDALQQEVGLCQAVAFIRAFHDVTDEFYQTELQETLPRLEGSLDSQSLAAAIAESPYAPALDRAFGPQLRRLLTLDHRIHAGGRDLQARISQLTALYQQLTASAKYPVQGELLSGGQLRAALASRDRARRKAAYDARQRALHARDGDDAARRHDVLRVVEQAVYARMISERNQIAEMYTADGEYEASIIRNDVDKQVNIMVSNAQAEAAKLEAEGEQEYMRLLAEAYDSPEKKDFYEFTLALDALKASLTGQEKTIILGKDSALAQALLQP